MSCRDGNLNAGAAAAIPTAGMLLKISRKCLHTLDGEYSLLARSATDLCFVVVIDCHSTIDSDSYPRM